MSKEMLKLTLCTHTDHIKHLISQNVMILVMYPPKTFFVLYQPPLHPLDEHIKSLMTIRRPCLHLIGKKNRYENDEVITCVNYCKISCFYNFLYILCKYCSSYKRNLSIVWLGYQVLSYLLVQSPLLLHK